MSFSYLNEIDPNSAPEIIPIRRNSQVDVTEIEGESDVEFETLKTLIREGSDSNVSLDLLKDNDNIEDLIQKKDSQTGMTLLHLAAKESNHSAMKILVDHGSDVNNVNNLDEGWTPSHYLAK